ncbi:hypothetical protein DESHY_130003 [Desulforamulus hydrothermalis Lam5 = DSM 18033]|uniref:Uncharacterized protein n=1 Tax=Desulforamulus hydrothermalis Lam5 = DSM 18033 TaxID=1121428 RepID=K8E8B4_9FIRM|nr:hypothetical protein DESHY_130003 [Desulforamulus hydrothermalis Lam5 = DSM 18033]
MMDFSRVESVIHIPFIHSWALFLYVSIPVVLTLGDVGFDAYTKKHIFDPQNPGNLVI